MSDPVQGSNPAPRLLPEWAPQDAVLLAWPHADTDWAPWLYEVQACYLDLVRALTEYVPVVILCRDRDHQKEIDTELQGAGIAPSRRHLIPVPYDDTWVRDYGPLTVQGPDGLRLLDFRFNGWGGKYAAERDDRVNRALAQLGLFQHVPMESLDWVLEGGAIDTDGAGTLITTARCVLSDTRNPGFDAARWEQTIGARLGAQRVLWLEHGGLLGDDTDGHVDTLVRFCNTETLAYVACDDPGDPHFEPLRAMEAELLRFRTAQGRPYRLVPLPLPAPRTDASGRRLPATYANFLITNGAVLVPVYGDPLDEEALARLRAGFPHRRIVPVPAGPLLYQYGSVHCVTMQLPRGVLGAG